MSSKDRTTSIKLDPEIRVRLYALAHVKCRSAHALMKEAIARYVLREEMALWEDYLAKHPTIAGDAELVRRSADLLPGPTVGLPEHVKQQIKDGNNRLRVLRGWRGMSLGRLVAAIDDLGGSVSDSMLAAIEDDAFRPGAGMTVLLAKALDVTVEDLVG